MWSVRYSFEKSSYFKVGQTCWGSLGTILVVWFNLWSLSPILGTNCTFGKGECGHPQRHSLKLYKDLRTWTLSKFSSHSLMAKCSCRKCQMFEVIISLGVRVPQSSMDIQSGTPAPACGADWLTYLKLMSEFFSGFIKWDHVYLFTIHTR